MAESFPLPHRLEAMLADLPLDQLAFTPVPIRARHDGWIPARQTAFIHRLALCGSPGASARAVGKTRESAYRLRARPGADGFAAAWDKALGWGQDSTLDLGLERALCGEEVPEMRAGRCVAVRRRYDNRLALAVLNTLDRRAARRPLGMDPNDAFELALAALETGDAATENTRFFPAT